MTIQTVLADAKENALFQWWWTEKKPGVLFLRSSNHPKWPSVHEVYNPDIARKLSERIRAAGGVLDEDSLSSAISSQEAWSLAYLKEMQR